MGTWGNVGQVSGNVCAGRRRKLLARAREGGKVKDLRREGLHFRCFSDADGATLGTQSVKDKGG